jgi:hypothetical protein
MKKEENTRGPKMAYKIPGFRVEDVPQACCPKCGAWIDDYDGFGVLAHKECGYCCHPSADGDGEYDVCCICGGTWHYKDKPEHIWGYGGPEA